MKNMFYTPGVDSMDCIFLFIIEVKWLRQEYSNNCCSAVAARQVSVLRETNLSWNTFYRLCFKLYQHVNFWPYCPALNTAQVFPETSLSVSTIGIISRFSWNKFGWCYSAASSEAPFCLVPLVGCVAWKPEHPAVSVFFHPWPYWA